MIAGEFNNIRISGVSTAFPTRKECNSEFEERFGKKNVEKIIESTGIRERYSAHEKQTASDLAFAAAKHLMEEKSIDPNSIGVLIFAAAHTDYLGPATAFVLQKRLGLSENCIVFDMNLGCSAFIYGSYTLSALLNAGSAERGLLLIGDTTTRTVSPDDTSRLLFSDGGAAICFEKAQDGWSVFQFGLKSDGDRFKTIIVPAGGYRLRDIPNEAVVWGDGIRRSDYNLFMNGMDVFSFSMTDVPELFDEFCTYFSVSFKDIDALVLHQANLFIIKRIAKKMGVDLTKVPISIDRYGNSSGCTIPVTLCDAYGDCKGKKLDIIMSGFGVGLSWGVARTTIETDAILPIIHTDEYYQDGAVSHD